MPDLKNLIAKLQSLISVTKSELAIVSLILLGLTVGLVYNSFFKYKEKDISPKEISQLLDSLANQKVSSYHGTELGTDLSTDTIKAIEHISGKSDTTDISDTTVINIKSELIDINIASLTTLMKLPGVGKLTAEKIINYRDKTPFVKPEDIMNVKGIGEGKYKKIKSFIRVN